MPRRAAAPAALVAGLRQSTCTAIDRFKSCVRLILRHACLPRPPCTPGRHEPFMSRCD